MHVSNRTIDPSYQTLINAYLREIEHSWQLCSMHELARKNQAWQECDKAIVISLPIQQIDIILAINYWSLTLRHQFHPSVVYQFTSGPAAYEYKTLSAVEFLQLTMREQMLSQPHARADLSTLALRCLLSQQNTNLFIKQRTAELEDLYSGRPLSFIESEQSLLIGHQLHPVAKSREGFSSMDLQAYSPETKGRFQLHYFAVHISLLHQDSALVLSSHEWIAQWIAQCPEFSQEFKQQWLEQEDFFILPAHPWQAQYLQQQQESQDLIRDKLLQPLGAAGPLFSATTSVRTVFNQACPMQFKFSLNVRITNSVRVNQSWELDRVVETAKMMQLPVADEIKQSAPAFEFVHEPAYLAIKLPSGKVLDGFSVIFRDNQTMGQPHRDISAVTSLVQDHPLGQKGRLYNIIKRISDQQQTPMQQVAITWFERYLEVAVGSLMRLFIDWGLCFEPHGQNALIEMEQGYPVRFFCRDGQGFFHRQAAHQDWLAIMPGKGEATQSIFPEELAKQRLIYYPFINQVFSMINAFGCQGLADEHQLMACLRTYMSNLAAKPQRYPFSLLEVLEKAERLPCKGNLLTQLYDMDELVGDIATQSVYVTLPNIYKAGA
ncbi:IucA/IucC family protein [Motilimonas sp. KMU-193]|uniref:IucA/IucC family protein n=1 Tax=Motilimonas sp. KMU-193 TaxID=3388668 RepID=UPI00396B0F77